MIGNKDTRKLIQALAYLAYKQTDQTLDNMKAYKLLWLADRYHLRQTGRTITGDRYYAMPFGIVPSDAKCLLENTKTKMFTPQRYMNKYITILENHKYGCINEPNLDEFSVSDLEALNKVLELYNAYSAKQLSAMSHEFPEWIFYADLLADKDKKNSYPIDLNRFFEDAPSEHNALFGDSRELLELTKELYHQYNC